MRLLNEGQALRGTYEVERFLGEGAFGEVYRVKHRFLGRQAMKVFKVADLPLSEVEELLSEAILLSRIGHPNIIRVFDAGVVDTPNGERGFFTMEYVPGGSLDQFWSSHGNKFVPIETSVEIIRQVCRGLAVAHAEDPPIVHRDVKPQNIIVGYDASGIRARLSDFGLAKRVNPLTLLASARGTPAFKPPEVFRDPQSDSCAADVWSVAATLYLLLTDSLPYHDDLTDPSSLARFRQGLAKPSALNISVDEVLEAVVLRALAPEPRGRHKDAGELLKDLDQWKPGLAKSQVMATHKEILTTAENLSEDEAHSQLRRALELSSSPDHLVEAADLLEQALNRLPALRPKYEYTLSLWRRGIVL